MAGKRTEKSKYQSRYSPDKYVTAAQWLCEFLCERKAKLEKKELPIQFWKLKEWSQFYRSQVNIVNELIKKYGEEVVILAARNPKASYLYSLRAPSFKSLLIEAQKIVETQQKLRETSIPHEYDSIDITAKPPVDFSSAKLSDRLRDL